ncbi:MAG TPA: peptidoglycan DD-metalloendopeptidase family protein [Candidatus Nanoarchaeia archaeon]|nr:peptidoglycan DD-metalloendopeptidase family protein [Candidatus Nanoarchaeia archaeon]
MKLLVLLKKFLAAFLLFVFKPLIALGKFIFLKVFVRIYLAYFSFAKKVGWSRLGGNFFSFLLSRKTVHIFLAILVAVVSFSGIMSQQTNAKSLFDQANKTIVSGLIAGEVADTEGGDLIEETAGSGTVMPSSGTQYLDNSEVAVNQLMIATSTATDEDTALADLGSRNDGMLIKPEVAMTEKSKKTRKSSINYTVQAGDTISSIAVNFGISVNTILWENNLSATSLIRPGDTLVILPATGITYKVAKGETLGAIANKFGVDANDILAANNLPEDTLLAAGQNLFIPGGARIYYAPAPTKVASTYNPLDVIKSLLSPSKAVAAAGKLLWPTVTHNITQYFSWAHKGLDIANPLGTPIYAAESGTVIDAGWSTAGYGNKIDIDHGGGMFTRYGHASKLLVKKGDVVERGQVIALIGSTGHSTGPHLHFEVHVNGKTYNPLDYLR